MQCERTLLPRRFAAQWYAYDMLILIMQENHF